MVIHPEERRAAALLRELILQRQFLVEAVEARLGWSPGRLAALLEGREGLGFTELLEVVGALDLTAPEFFARLYGFGANSADAYDVERCFEESRRVIKDAIARRQAWKRERGEI